MSPPDQGNAVRIVFTKWDESLHWHFEGTVLGEDEYGVWIGMPAGTLARRGIRRTLPFRRAVLFLAPRDKWWTATFNLDLGASGSLDDAVIWELYCDIGTVPQWRAGPGGDEVTMVDLDLDIIARSDGKLFIDDEDEFIDHQELYGYPDDVIAAARTSADDLLSAVSKNAEPFRSHYVRWAKRLGVEVQTS
ncbi:DUF402 domain-containing protein [Saxibacter everestensis]|uniref:DUF402 domain-containing protein n=1 Tax=Saxibacter everestensis TaxID=2909229 RepID=A0ABY8QZS7_9MICO|nr:DUF402 domain-containing protein [Brevibacteriaceae bacterium ZFBP1038]